MILALDVWAQFGCWGTTALSTGNTAKRETQLPPGKAAIAGILGAAIGIQRDALPGLAQEIRVACRTDAMPSRQPSSDYESTRRIYVLQNEDKDAPKTSRFEDLRALDKINRGAATGSILSTREYWSAGGWTVFVAGEAALLSRLEAGLQSPCYPVFAGRRSCSLAFPPAPVMLSSDGLAEAVRGHPGLHARLQEPILKAALAGWRTVKSGVMHWEDGFPGAMPAMTRRLVRQLPLPVPLGGGQPRHLLRLFGEYVECSVPGVN
jgi:CRISPR system Cascade subunit CasD